MSGNSTPVSGTARRASARRSRRSSVASSLAARPSAAWWHQLAGALGLLGVLLAAFRVWRSPAHPPGVLYDDGQYFELALALRAGAYRHELMQPALDAVHFPPGYPAWLVAWDALGRMWGTPAFSMSWLLLGNQVLVILGALVFYLVVVRVTTTPPWLVAAALVLGIVFPPAWVLWNTLMSEPLAFAVLGVAVFALCHMESLRREGRFPDRWALWGVVAAIAAGCLPVIRSIWIPVVAVACWYLLAALRRHAWGWWFAASAALLGPSAWWAVWTSKRTGAIPAIWAENYGAYAAFAAPVWARDGFLAAQWEFQVRSAARIVSFLWGHPVATVLALGLMAVGVWALARSRGWPALCVASAYLALVAIWPFWPDRFLWGIAPFLSLSMALGVTTLWRAARARSRSVHWMADFRRFGGSLVVMLVVGGLTADWVRRMRPLMRVDQVFAPTVGRAVESHRALVRYARALPPDQLVAVGNDVLVRLWAGRATVPLLPGEPGIHVGVPARAIEARLEAALCVAPAVVATYLRVDTLVDHAVARVLASGRLVADTMARVPMDADVMARAVRCPAQWRVQRNGPRRTVAERHVPLRLTVR